MDEKRLEELSDRLGRWAMFGIMCLLWPFQVIFGTLAKMVEAALEFIARFRPEDPYKLNVFGDSLRTTRVRFDQFMLAVLLTLTGAYIFWAWKNGFSFTGASDAVVIGLATVIFVILMVFDRSLGVVDLHGVKQKCRYWLPRSLIMLGLAFITAIPVELAYFAPEIEARIAAAEKVDIDLIRAKAKQVETNLAEQRKNVTSVALTGSPDKVVARREEERKQLLAKQTADRAEITGRLEGASDSVVSEVAKGSRKRRTNPGAGQTAAELRRQEAKVREELKEFNAAARVETKDFDAVTEQMRADAARTATDELAGHDVALTAKLQEVEAMPAAELAAAYGGAYERPRGFLARKVVLDQIMREPQRDAEGNVMDVFITDNQATGWACRFMMMVPEFIVIIWKFLLCSREFAIYISRKMQALSLNKEAVRQYIPEALNKDPEAIEVLRMVAADDAEAANALKKLGFTALNVEAAGYTPEVLQLQDKYSTVEQALHEALATFQHSFRELCERRSTDEPPVAFTRAQIVGMATRLWDATVQPKIRNLNDVEAECRFVGTKIPTWEGEAPDPRSNKNRLWNLPDDVLIGDYGWTTPANESIRAAEKRAATPLS